MFRFRIIHGFLFAFAGAALLLGGCDNAISPISDEGAFTIHGALNASVDRQFVRVRALNSPLTPDATRNLDATVRVENLRTGAVTPLRDSVAAFGAVYVHNFWANFDVAPDTEYRVVAERSDGATSAATMRTPSVVEVERSRTEGDCLDQYLVRFLGVRELSLIRPRIGFQFEGRTFWVPRATGFRGGVVSVSFQPEEVLAEEIGSRDNPSTRLRYEPRCLVLTDDTLRVAYKHLGPAWSGRIPGDLDFDPTTSDVVDNGLGFFGGYREDTVAVRVDTSGVIPLGPGG